MLWIKYCLGIETNKEKGDARISEPVFQFSSVKSDRRNNKKQKE